MNRVTLEGSLSERSRSGEHTSSPSGYHAFKRLRGEANHVSQGGGATLPFAALLHDPDVQVDRCRAVWLRGVRCPMRPAPVVHRARSSSALAITIEGVLERVTYANDENAWSVVKLVVPSKADLVTAVGNLLGVQPGESLRLSGRWTTDKKYGEQFKVESYVTVKPATLVGIEKYLGSGLVRGVG